MRPVDVTAGLSDREKLEALIQKRVDRRRKNPITYGHALHEGQQRIVSSEARRKLVVAANRWGKTEGMIRDCLWRARGKHPYRKVRLHSAIWIGSPDYPSYLRFHKPAFDQWCPAEWIVGEFNTSDKWVDIRRVDGGICRIFFLSYDMARSKWQGAGVDHIWLDEEMPEDIVNECLARIVTTRGSITLTFTPVSGVGWWFDRFYVPGQAGKSQWVVFQAALATMDPQNEKEFNVGESLVPHLTREQIIEFASEYPDPDERAIRVFGAVKARTGLVYKAFNTAVHSVPRFVVPPSYELWGAVDPGYHGFAAIIAAISPEGRIYVVAEFFSQQETTRARFEAITKKVREVRTAPDAATRLRDPFQALRFRLYGDSRVPDPIVVPFFVDTEDPQVVLELNTMAQEVAASDAENDAAPVVLAFSSLNQGLKARKAGFLRVQQLLEPDEKRRTPEVVNRPRPPQGEPTLYVFDDLYSEWQGEDRFYRESRVVWELSRYSWRKPPRGSTVQPDDGDENSAGGAHAMATFRYLVMARMGPPEEPKKERGVALVDSATLAAWADIEELEQRQLEEAGLL